MITSDVKQHLFNQSLHPFQTSTFILNYFESTQESFYPYSNTPIVIIHYVHYFYFINWHGNDGIISSILSKASYVSTRFGANTMYICDFFAAKKRISSTKNLVSNFKVERVPWTSTYCSYGYTCR